MSEFLVTGGAGFIGSNIVRKLVEQGRSVRVLDNLLTGRMSNIEDQLDRIEFVEGDLRDQRCVTEAVSGTQFVLHLAALPSVPRSVEDPVETNAINIDGTVNLLVAARDAGVDRLVFSSSSSVYGDTETLPKREDMIPQPLSPYAIQKLTGEHYCKVFHRLYGFKAFVLRYFNVFGPRQNPGSAYAAVIPLFIAALAEGRSPTVYGDGEQTRDFTFVDDVVSANLCCCEAPEDAAGGVYNVACGVRTSLNTLLETLRGILDSDIQAEYTDRRAGDVVHSQGDSARARAAIGWEWKVSLEEGLRKTVEYFVG